jgi:hypothetical protein
MSSNRRFGMVLLIFVAVLMSGLGIVSHAQAKPVNETAMSALKLAKHHYKKENFKKAAALFVEAFDIEPNPLFLYNAGRALQRGFMLDEAEKAFTRFVEAEKSGKFEGADHEAAKRRATMHLKEIRSTKAQLHRARQRGREDEKTQTQAKQGEAGAQAAGAAQEGKAATAQARKDADKPETTAQTVTTSDPAAATVPAAASTESWKTPAAFGLMGVGVGVIGYGIWLLSDLVARKTSLDEATRAGNKIDGKLTGSDAQTYQASMDELQFDQNIAFAAIGVGVVAAGAGGYLLSIAPGVRNVTLAPHISGRGATFSMRF